MAHPSETRFELRAVDRRAQAAWFMVALLGALLVAEGWYRSD
jgi:hypothetical protein